MADDAQEAEKVELKSTDAPAVRDELERIRKEHSEGLLVPEEVVDNARHPDNPLHRFFDWSDDRAAEKWRLAQARSLIRQIKIVYPNDPEERLLPRYVSLTPDRNRSGGGYRPTREVLDNEQLRKELEATARKELMAWTQRYSLLSDIAKLAEEVIAEARKAAEAAASKRKKK